MNTNERRPREGTGALQPTATMTPASVPRNLDIELPDTEVSTLSVALALAARGMHVFPVDSPELPACVGLHGRNTPCDGQRGKHPAAKWSVEATADRQAVTAMFAGAARNIGVSCGPSGLVVLDEDAAGELVRWQRERGVTLVPTFTVATGRGRHLYYRAPDGSVIGNSKTAFEGFKIDVRGVGGYVVGPGSLHAATGALYTVVDSSMPVTPLPAVLATKLAAPARQASPASPDGGSMFASTATHTGPIGYGNRHDRLVSYAGRLRARGLDLTEAEVLLRGRWLDCVQPPGTEPEARWHEPAPAGCGYPVTWVEARAKLADVFGRYAAGDTGDGVPDDSAEVHHGQARIAYRLAQKYDQQLMYVHGIGWHAWDGARWTDDDRGAAKRAVLAVLRDAHAESIADKELRLDVRRCESAAGVGGVLDLAAALEPFAHTVADLDADPYLLNVANGTLDLRTLQLRGHDPADRITKVTRAAYRPEVAGSTWAGFLDRVLPDAEVHAFLQRLAGVGLLGTVVEHVLAILTGSGANGKGTWYKALGYALGDYAATAEPDLFMHRDGAHPTGEMDLRGVRWVVVSESDKDRHLAEATMKRLTGGDPIRARRMRQDFVEFTPSHTAALVTNHLPKVSGDDPAIWRRIRVVPFNVVIPADEQDGHLDERLQLDADAVLGWAVAGYRQYTDGGLAEPAAVRVATDTYQLSSDAIARFLDERCLLFPHMFATTAELFAAWTPWATDDGAEQLSQKAFGAALDAKGFPATKGGKGRRLRHGVGLAAVDKVDD